MRIWILSAFRNATEEQVSTTLQRKCRVAELRGCKIFEPYPIFLELECQVADGAQSRRASQALVVSSHDVARLQSRGSHYEADMPQVFE